MKLAKGLITLVLNALLHNVWPTTVRAYRGEVKAMFDLLGGDHDLRVVHAILVERPASVGAARQFKGGLDLIERR